MGWIVRLGVIWLVTAASLLLITKLPLGVEINNFKRALNSAAVFGVFNAILEPLLNAAFTESAPLTLFWVSFFFSTLINGILLSIVALLTQGLQLRHGIQSAAMGAIALGLVNAWLFRLLGESSF